MEENMMKRINKTMERLQAHNMAAYYVETKAEVVPLLKTLMKEGEKIRVWIHPELGYGSYGNSVIGPNQLLIFDIELVSVDSTQQ